MAAPRRSALIDKHIAALKAMKSKSVEAGWFDSDRYPAAEGNSVGMSVAKVARIQEFGGTIHHPGGTKYIEDAIVNGKFVGTRFVKSDFQGEHKVTAAHDITIPARPFMRLAWSKFGKSREKIQGLIARQLIDKKIGPDQAMEQIGLAMKGCIVDSIKNGGWEPNAASTVAKKGFDSPLRDTGHLWQTVSSKVT